MRKYSILVLFSMVTGGCSLLEPKGEQQDTALQPEEPARGYQTALSESVPPPPDTIVLPLKEITVETQEIVLPDSMVTNAADPELSHPPGEHRHLPAKGRTAGLDAKIITIPARDDSFKRQPTEPPADAIRVEIINTSGVPGLDERVSKRLASENYLISLAKSDPASEVRDETWIKYRADFVGEAVHLGHILPGNQIVTRGDELPDEIDIRIIVGADQK